MSKTWGHQCDFLTLVQANRERILKICRVYAPGRQDQEDLYQEVLFQIWRGLPNLKDVNFANTWVYRVSLNAAISFARKDTQRRAIPTEHGQLVEWSDQRQPAHSWKDNPRVELLYDAIGKLNPYEKAVITLYLEEMSYAQIAQVMGMNANQVGVMLHRTKNKLSVLIDEVVI